MAKNNSQKKKPDYGKQEAIKKPAAVKIKSKAPKLSCDDERHSQK